MAWFNNTALWLYNFPVNVSIVFRIELCYGVYFSDNKSIFLLLVLAGPTRDLININVCRFKCNSCVDLWKPAFLIYYGGFPAAIMLMLSIFSLKKPLGNRLKVGLHFVPKSSPLNI